MLRFRTRFDLNLLHFAVIGAYAWCSPPCGRNNSVEKKKEIIQFQTITTQNIHGWIGLN